jgi:hypothetical protein
MAATYTAAKFPSSFGSGPNPDDTWGKEKVRFRTITLAGTYTTGGDALYATRDACRALFGFGNLLALVPIGPATDGTLSYDVTFVRSSLKLKLWETGSAAAGSAEKGSGESLTGITLDVMAVGV